MREMKNSGVAWIGEIPAEWDVLRNKNLVYEINERCDADTRLPLLSVSEYYGVAPKAEKTDENTILSRAETLEGYKICEPDDVAMNIMLAWKRAQAVSKYHGIISPAYCVYRKKEDAPLNMDFFHYLIRSDLYINIYKRYSTGIIESRLRLYPEKFLSLHSHVPPIVEQQEIAKVLDVKSSQIDILIANQEAQIEKLKQYKQSLITEVVTKGLNPDVEMKDSGVEWIGEIPKHWRIWRTKFLGKKMYKGAGITKEDVVLDGDTSCVRYGEIYTKYNHSFTECFSKTNHKNLSVLQYFSYGDILFAGTGELPEEIGKNVVYLGKEKCLAGGDIIVLHHSQNPSYLNYLLNSKYSQSQKSCSKAKLKVVHISQTDIGNVYLPIAPIDEQNIIADFLDNQCAQIDKLIEIKQSKIAKLNEYKKSLIYEYVTGKKEVV